MTITNELNERDKTIVDLRAKESSLLSTLKQKESMHEQDAMMRIQLGKRLEQVLMDKEEAVEQLEMMRVRLLLCRYCKNQC